MSLEQPPRQGAGFASSRASVWLDAIRACAALLVLLEHWRNLFFLDFPQLTAHRALLVVPYALSSVGHQAVIVFFLLSGYFIGGSVLQSVARHTWTWKDYLLKRIVRLWIVLIPSLLLCASWDLLGLHLNRAPDFYGGLFRPAFIPDVLHHLTLKTFLGNLFFLQGILTSTFGSDGPLWSLSYEFWYYMLFPLAFFALRRQTKTTPRLLCIALFAAIAFLVRGPILLYFSVWLAGALLHRIPQLTLPQSSAARLRWLAVLLAIPVFLAIGKQKLVSEGVGDAGIAIMSFLVLWCLLSARNVPAPQGSGVPLIRVSARFSYSLYTLHLPLLLLLKSVIQGNRRWTPSPLLFLLALAPLALTIIYAYAVASLTEFHTDTLRRWLERRLHLHPMR